MHLGHLGQHFFPMQGHQLARSFHHLAGSSQRQLHAGALSRRTDRKEYPEYTPDFVRLAESYGAKGIRVTKKEEIAAAFEEAKKSTRVPTLIEFIIDPDEMVYPMIKPGGTLEDMIMDC